MRLFHSFQSKATQSEMSSKLRGSNLENKSIDRNASIDRLQDTATNNYLAMLEIEVKKHWGI